MKLTQPEPHEALGKTRFTEEHFFFLPQFFFLMIIFLFPRELDGNAPDVRLKGNHTYTKCCYPLLSPLLRLGERSTEKISGPSLFLFFLT